MKKTCFAFLILLVFSSCTTGTIKRTAYTANPINVTDPISVIKNTIQQQPPAYSYMPVHIEVDDKCIKLYMERHDPTTMAVIGGGGGVAVGPGTINVSPEFVCYKNIGRIGLSHIEKDNLWRVEIDDKRGHYMYWVHSYERSDAERFIDAIYNFINLKN